MPSEAIKILNKRLRAVVNPALKAHGFRPNTSKVFVREFEDVLQVVFVKCFSPYQAERHDITTASFSARLSIFCPFIPGYAVTPIKGKYKGLDVGEIFGHPLLKDIHQPQVQARRENIWFVTEDGSNVDLCVESLARTIKIQAIPWFDRLTSVKDVFELVKQPQTSPDLGLFGQGNAGSPHNDYLRGFFLEYLGDFPAAEKYLQKAFDSNTMNNYWLADALKRVREKAAL